jgi:SAM-dependent methyltransferase
MPDVYATITELDAAMLARLADVLETRGADPQQQALRRAFLAAIAFPTGARVLEVGCGTSVLTRVLARWPDVAEVVGVDPSPYFLSRARELASDLGNVTLQEADGRALPFDDESLDVVVFDSTLSHVPSPAHTLPLRTLAWLVHKRRGHYLSSAGASPAATAADLQPVTAAVAFLPENRRVFYHSTSKGARLRPHTSRQEPSRCGEHAVPGLASVS